MANGIYTNSELVDTIIVDLNSVLKEALNGQYIQACRIVTMMSQKLVNLKTSIDNDLKSRDQVIADLKAELRVTGREVIEMTGEELAKEVRNGGK